MTDTPQAVLEELRLNNERPYGRQRTVAAEQLVDAADQFDDAELLVTALLELMEAYEYDAEPRKSPVVFARVLKLWDDKPEAFSEWEAGQVFWRFKWVAAALLRVPEVPLEAVRQWHEEMRDRYRGAGHGLQPYYGMRYQLAAHTGAAVEDAYDLWATRPRTELTDCAACEVRHRAVHQVLLGDDDAALTEWEPVLTGEGTCSEEPHTSQAYALLPLVRAGRLDEARSAHLAGYRRSRGRSATGAEIGLHLEFCALTRNEGRGLEVLAENRELFGGASDPLAHLDFLTGAEVLLARLADAGHGDAEVSGPPGRGWTAASLLDHVRTEAAALAARFDGRNGTSAVGDRRRARLTRQPLLAEPLPLGVRAPAVVTPAPAQAPAATEIPEDFAELVRRAREHRDTGRPGDEPLWHRIGERLDAGAEAPDPKVRAELAVHRGLEFWNRDEKWTAGRALMAEAAALFEELGCEGEALGARARLATSHFRAEEPAEVQDAAWASLEEILHRAEELRSGADGGIDDRDYLLVLHCRTSCVHHRLTEALPEAPEELEREFLDAAHALRDAADALGVPHRRAVALSMLGHVAARRERLDEAEALVRESVDLVTAAGEPWRGNRNVLLLAQITLQQERHEEASDLVHRAVADAVRWGETDFPHGPAKGMLGHARMHLGDAEGAARALTEAVDWFDRHKDHEEAASARLQLADALSCAGRAADGVAVLESMLGDAGSLEERLAAQARLSLGRGLRALGEHRAAAQEFLLLAEQTADWPEQDIHTMVACDAASALAAAGSWEAADTARERALAAHGRAPRHDNVTPMLCESAQHLMDQQGADALDRALALLATADELLAEAAVGEEPVPVWYHQGAVRYRRARCLAEAERFEEALGELEASIAGYAEGGPQAEEPRAESVRVAAMIEGHALGRPAAAVTRLGDAIRRCEQAGHMEAARILAALREQLAGRG
ncbi:hypothetical protein AB0M28_14725 [Streptomyces sp. NPDC051940]|uniref:hypothetical protein n=1 Tax=Streptomyces sp. NPDC051940 TaxID=3155675 RepID=UPI0034308463